MVVVITSSGGVSKLFATFDGPVDSGLLAWAGEYLRERLVGYGLGARMLQQRLIDPSLGRRARFLQRWSRRSASCQRQRGRAVRRRHRALARRPVGSRTRRRSTRGWRRSSAACRCCACCAARSASRASSCASATRTRCRRCARWRSWRPATACPRKLGAVSVIGPVRMDYGARDRHRPRGRPQLSRFVEDVYAERLTRTGMPARPIRGARRRARAFWAADQEGLSPAGARAAPGRQRARPARRGEVQGGRRGLRDPLRRRAPRRPMTATATRDCAAAAMRPTSTASARSVICSMRSSVVGSAAASAAHGGGPVRRRRDSRSRSTSRRQRPACGSRSLRGGRRCAHCHGNGAEPGTPIATCDRCGGAGQSCRWPRARRSGRWCAASPATSATARAAIPEQPCASATAAGASSASASSTSTCRRASPTASASACGGSGHAGEPGGPAGDLYVQVQVRPDGRLCATATTSSPCWTCPRRWRRSAATCPCRPRRRAPRCDVPTGTQPGEMVTVKGQGMPQLRRPDRRGNLRVVVNVVIPRRLSAEQRELLGQLADSLTAENLPLPRTTAAKLRRAARRPAMIRLALRVRREDAELALAELLELAPSGVEERELEGGAVIEYAVYGAPGELPALPDLQAAAGGALVEIVDRGDRRRLARALEGVPPAGRCARRRARRHRAARAPAVGGAARRRDGRGDRGDRDRSRARRSAPARITPRGCAWSCCWSSSPAGPARRRLRFGSARDRRRAAGLGAGARGRPRGRERQRRRGQRARRTASASRRGG